MKPERLVDEVFSYGNINYLHVEIIRRRRHRRRQKIYAKIGEIL